MNWPSKRSDFERLVALRQSESLNVVCMPNLFLFLFFFFSFLYELFFFNRRSRVRAVVSRASTGLVGQNTSCKAHKVCISLWPTGWDDVFCS